jgi:hypothetical protein
MTDCRQGNTPCRRETSKSQKSMIKKYLLIMLIAPLLTALSCKDEEPKTEEKKRDDGVHALTITPDRTSLLRNPCMGWGLYDDAVRDVAPAADYWRLQGAAALQYASYFYVRWRWAEMEPEEGRYAWLYDNNYKSLIQGALDRGLKLAFCIYDNAQDNLWQATPDYVRTAGAEGYTVTGQGKSHWTPYSDDPVFKAKLEKFVEAFAAEYDNPDIVDFVDGFVLGWWGECNNIRLKNQTPANLETVFDWYTSMYADNFRKVLLVMPFNNQVGFATEKRVAYEGKGYGLQRNGLGSQYFNDTEKGYANEMYGHRLLIGEQCYWDGDMSDNLWFNDTKYHFTTWRQIYEVTFSDAIDNHFNTLDLRTVIDTKRWLDRATDLVERFKIEGGYRLYPPEIVVPKTLTGGNITIEHKWTNTGNGYLPNNMPNWNYKYKPAFALLNTAGEVVKLWIDNDAEPSAWLAGKDYTYTFEVSTAGIPAGKYRWAVAIIDKTKDNTPGIRLAISGYETVNGWTALADAEVQ